MYWDFNGWARNPVPGPQDAQRRVAIIVTRGCHAVAFLAESLCHGPMGFTHIGDWVGKGMSDDFREEFRRGYRELPLVTREVLCAKIFS